MCGIGLNPSLTSCADRSIVFTRSTSLVPGSVDLSTIEKMVPGGIVTPFSPISLTTLAMLVRQLISYVLLSAYCCTRWFVWLLIGKSPLAWSPLVQSTQPFSLSCPPVCSAAAAVAFAGHPNPTAEDSDVCIAWSERGVTFADG